MITQTQLKNAFEYRPDTGLLLWRHDRAKVRAGQRAGWLGRDGYRYVWLDYVTRKEHRFIWLLMTGQMPPKDIDHINGVKSDNRWCNLRAATRSQNRANMGIQGNNTSGHRGVYWSSARGKWVAMIGFKGRRRTLGRFEDLESAATLYESTAKELFGAFYKEPV
jgi:hypothetical protein